MFPQQEDRGSEHLNYKEKASIVDFTEAVKSISYISRMLSIGEATVVRRQKMYNETGDVENKVGSGRKRKTTAAQDRQKTSVVRWETNHYFSRDSW